MSGVRRSKPHPRPNTMSMRLAILTSHPIQYYAPLFRELAKHLDIEVFFAHKATPGQQAAAGFETEFDWDVDLLEGYPHTFLRNDARNPGTSRFSGYDTPEIAGMLANGRFGALLITGWHLRCYWQAIWSAKRLGIPILVRGDSQLETPRSGVKRLVKQVAYPVFLRLFDAALYVGQRNRAYYERYRYPVQKLFYSPHCVDTARFAAGASKVARISFRAQMGIKDADQVALFAGKLVEFKRPLDLLEAASVLRVKGVPIQVMVAGSGPLERELEVRAETLRIPLHLLGFQNQTQMPAAYAAADVLVLPSNGRETWGLVCNEALACGTPIVVSDAAGCSPDLALDNVAGRAFPMGDIGSLSTTLGQILESPPSPEGIHRVSEAYSIQSAIAGITSALAMLGARAGKSQ